MPFFPRRDCIRAYKLKVLKVFFYNDPADDYLNSLMFLYHANKTIMENGKV